jgi:hypothetical protein
MQWNKTEAFKGATQGGLYNIAGRKQGGAQLHRKTDAIAVSGVSPTERRKKSTRQAIGTGGDPADPGPGQIGGDEQLACGE